MQQSSTNSRRYQQLALYSMTAGALGATATTQAAFQEFAPAGGLPIVIEPDTTGVALDIDGNGFIDFQLNNEFGTYSTTVTANDTYGAILANTTSSYAADIAGETTVDANLVTGSTDFQSPQVAIYTRYLPTTALPRGQVGVIGLRFKIGGNTHYGCLVTLGQTGANNDQVRTYIFGGGYEDQAGAAADACQTIYQNALTLQVDGFESSAPVR